MEHRESVFLAQDLGQLLNAPAGTDLRPLREALMAASGTWQPIETAPKDGTEFLCYWKPLQGDAEIVRAAWLANRAFGDGFYGFNLTGLDGRRSADRLWGGWPEEKLLATHWMPLPKPPAS